MPLLPSTSLSSLTGLTYQDLLGTSDPLGIAENPDIGSIMGPDPLRLGFATGRKKKPKYPPLPEDQQKTVVKKILDTGLGGLQYIGETLDKPGRAARGLLAGKPGELLNLIPFSDTMGLTDPGKSVGGRELLEQYGLAGPNRPGLFPDEGSWNPDWGDIAGFGVELATDPLSYLVGPTKALTAAGQVAKKAGYLKGVRNNFQTLAKATKKAPKGPLGFAEGIGESLGAMPDTLPSKLGQEQLGGLFGLKFPGLGETYVPGIAKGNGAKAVAELAGGASDWIGSTKPAVIAKGLFDYKSGGRFNNEQQMASRISKEYGRPAEARTALKLIGVADDIEGVHKAFGQEFGQWADDAAKKYDTEYQRALLTGGQEAADAIPKPEDLRSLANRTMQLAAETRDAGTPALEAAYGRNLPQQPSIGLKSKMGQLMDKMVTMKDELADSTIAKGGKLSKMFEDVSAAEIGHYPRFIEELKNAKNPADITQFKQLKTTYDSMIARNSAIKYLPGPVINEMLRDPEVLSALSLESSKSIYDLLTQSPKYGDILRRSAQSATAKSAELAGKVPAAVTKDMKSRLREMGYTRGEIAAFTPEAAHGILNPVKQFTPEDIIDDLESWLTGKIGADGTSKFKFSDDPFENLTRNLKGSHVADANLEAIHQLAGRSLVPGGIPVDEAFKTIGLTDKAPGYFRSKFGDVPAGMGIDPKVVTAAKSFIQKSPRPEWLEATSKAVGGMTDFFKRRLTLPFINFATRNLASGQWMNLVMSNELGLKDIPHYLKNVQLVKDMLDDPKKYKSLIDEALAWGAIPKDFDSLGVPLHKTATSGHLPNPISLKGMKQNITEGWKEAGVAVPERAFGREIPSKLRKLGQIEGTAAQIGGNVNAQVEFANRMAMYKTMREMGHSPQEASRIVRELQVAYEELAPFEKDVMKNLVPFYCVPESATVLTRDGWKTCDDLIVGEEILTYNQHTDRSEWQPCLEKAIFDFDGELKSIQNTAHKILCTDNHRWAVERSTGRQQVRVPQMREAWELNTADRIIVSAKLTAAEDSILTPEQARLLGWMVTDGYHRHRGNHVEAMVYQHPSKFLDEVKEVAGGKPRKPHPQTGVVCVPVLKERTKEIKQYLDKNELVTVVTRLSREAAEAMYDAMYKGDGTVGKRTCDYLACQHPGVRLAAEVLCALLGKRTCQSKVNRHGLINGMTTSNNRYISVHATKIGTEHYKGRVWCPRTDNGTWVMKQGKLVTITGNTYIRKTVPLMFRQMLERPGGGTAQTIRASNIGHDDSEFIPGYIGEGLSIKTGENSYLSQFGLPTDQFSDLFAKGPSGMGTVKRTLQKLASHTHPLVKGTAELTSGINFLTGKPMTDLYQYPTSSPLANSLLADSPVSRLISTARTIGDPRPEKKVWQKAANVLTGLKFSSPTGGVERQMDLAAKKLIEEVAKENEKIGAQTNLFVKEGETLTPGSPEEELFRAYTGLSQKIQKQNKAKKEEEDRKAGKVKKINKFALNLR